VLRIDSNGKGQATVDYDGQAADVLKELAVCARQVVIAMAAQTGKTEDEVGMIFVHFWKTAKSASFSKVTK